MWPTAILLLFVTYASADSTLPHLSDGGAWEYGKVYQYKLTGRSSAALHQLAHQYTGVLFRGFVDVQKTSENVLGLKFSSVQYADFNRNLTSGWETPINAKEVTFQSVNINNERAELTIKNGVISSFVVNGKLKEWQVNILKAIISLLQIDAKGENAIRSTRTHIATGKFSGGFFRTMEDTVSGQCLTTYTVVPLQKYMIQSYPQMVPLPRINGENSKFVQFIKVKNYSHCDVLPRYNFGFAGGNNFEPASSHMGNLLSRSSLSRVTVTANSVKEFTIQSSVTTEQVIVAPNLFGNLNGLVATKMNLTLKAVTSASESTGSQQGVPNPKTYTDLVYSYNPASSNPNAKSSQINENFQRSRSNKDSSQSSSSEEKIPTKMKINGENNNGKGGRGSSSSSSSEEYYKKSSNNQNTNVNVNTNNQKSNKQGDHNTNINVNTKKNTDENNYSDGYGSYNNEGNAKDIRAGNDNVMGNSGTNSRSRRSVAASRERENSWGAENKEGSTRRVSVSFNGKKYSEKYDSFNNNDQNNNDSENNEGVDYQNNQRNNDYNNYNHKYQGFNVNDVKGSIKIQNQTTMFIKKYSKGSKYLKNLSSSSSSEENSSGSSSFSSNEDNLQQTHAKMNEAPFVPFLPHFIGVEGNSIQTATDFNVIKAVEKMTHQIAIEIRNSESLSSQHTMSKFIRLTQFVETMNTKQMLEVVRLMYVNMKQIDWKNSDNVKNLVAWQVFKNALAAAGTGSALETIKNLIESEKIVGERAAQIISHLPKAAKIPNEQYMELFFSLVKSVSVQKQHSLNATAVIAFAELLRMTHVSNGTAHLRYPLHAFGRFGRIATNMNEKYLPFFEDNMKEAIQNNDGHKAQVFIRALGLTGHQRIVPAFEEFLEGKKLSSHFHRFIMITNLYNLAKIQPHLARPILLKVYQNFAEKEELRVLAVSLLFFTNPPAELLQRLAHATHYEPNRSVKSAIIDSIESAAANPMHLNTYFVKNAQAAVNHLKSKNYGLASSLNHFFTLATDDVEYAFETVSNLVRSKDHIYPHSVFFNLRPNSGRVYESSSHFSAMTSSVNQLLKKFSEQFKQTFKKSEDSSSKASNTFFSAEKIAKELGIKIASAPEVEASLLFKMFGGKRAISLGNHSIESIPQMIKEQIEDLKKIPHIGFTKVYNDEQIQLGFPTPMGLPFVFTYTRPVMVHVNGEFNIHTHLDISSSSPHFIHVPEQFNASFAFETSFAVHSEGKLGFVTPGQQQEYFASVVKNIEFNLGLKTDFGYNSRTKEVYTNVSPYSQDHKQVIFEYRTIPFTSKSNIVSQKPALEQTGSEWIHVGQHAQTNYVLGKETTGIALSYNASSERVEEDEHFFDFSLFNFDRMQTIPFPFIRRGLHANNVRIVYDPALSSTDSVNFNIAIKHKYTVSRSGAHYSEPHVEQTSNRGSPNFQDAIPSPGADSYKRQQELFSRVSEGVPEADAYLVDFSAELGQAGQSNRQVIATLTFASSDVSPIAKTIFYYGLNPRSSGKSHAGKSFEVCASTKAYFPRVPEIDMNDALNANPNSTFQANVAFGRDCKNGYHVETQTVLSQSNRFWEYRKEYAMVHLCKQQMEKGHYLNEACKNATQMANELDNIKFYFNFNWDSESSRTMSGDVAQSRNAAQEYSLFAPISVWLHKLGLNYVYNTEKIQGQILPRNKVEVSVQFSEERDYVNFTVLHGGQETTFSRAYFDSRLRFKPYRSAHWLINSFHKARENNWKLPSCSLNQNGVNTFDNASYSVNFENDWHTVLLYTPIQIDAAKHLADRDSDVLYEKEYQNIAILAKQSANGKEVKMILGDNMVELKPSGQISNSGGSNSESGASRGPAAHVTINGRQASFSSEHSASVLIEHDKYQVKVFANPNGEVTVKSQKYGITLKYYGSYVDIYASGYYKSNIRGLCGTYDGNKLNDFTTPRNCIVKESHLFAASYVVSQTVDEEISAHTKAMKRDAANAECYKETFQYSDVISDAEAGRYGRKRSSNGNSMSNDSDDMKMNYIRGSSCTNYRPKYVQGDRPNTICFSNYPLPRCRSGCQPTNHVEKEEPFVCMMTSQTTEFWKHEIDNGRPIDFSQKETNETIKVQVPQSCKPDYSNN